MSPTIVDALTATDLGVAFDHQVETLLRKGYPTFAQLTPDAFLAHLTPLRAQLPTLDATHDPSRIPFVIVIKSALVATDPAMAAVQYRGSRGEPKQGYTKLDPKTPEQFAPIDHLTLPDTFAYLITDIDTGRATLNITPDDALPIIQREGRSPLTIDEGIALVTHYPELLRTHNAFSLLGSRCGDKRVPAIWLSAGAPRLGWCWAGNPHTWLGSGSCERGYTVHERANSTSSSHGDHPK